MHSRAVLAPEPLGKLNEKVPRRNKRVALRDRTNVEASQLFANAQKKNNVKPVQVPSLQDKVAANRKCNHAKQAVDEDVIVITSDEEDEKSVIRSKPSQGSRKEAKTFTSVLTARSKAMAGEASNKPKEQIVDFDSADANDELAVVEYVDDMFKFYKLEEDGNRVRDYFFNLQLELNSKMRSILIDWLIHVHLIFKLMPETFYLTVNILDRYLSLRTVRRSKLQLVGVGSMLIAAKYEEIWPPQVNDFVSITDHAYMHNEVLDMEKEILGMLDWYLTVPTPYVFLARYIKASVSHDDEMKNLVFFLAELGIMHYQTIISYSPSMIAAAAVYAARCTLNPFLDFNTEAPHWLFGRTVESNAAKGELNAAYRKYSKPEFGAVAHLYPAKTL